MQQGDFIRAGGLLVVAGTGAGLALAGAALTGNLGSSTTIEQVTTPPVIATSLANSGRGLSVQEIYRLDAPGVVRISNADARPPAADRSLGSGFVIDKAGHIVTSNLVVSGVSGIKVSFSGSDEVDASVVGHDIRSRAIVRRHFKRTGNVAGRYVAVVRLDIGAGAVVG